MLTPLRPGICYGCQSLVWRMAAAAKKIESQGIAANQPFLLWPESDTVYARIETESGITPGITFCPDCAPALGSHLEVLAQPTAPTGVPMLDSYTVGGPVIGFDSALARYSGWFTDERGQFWRAWLRDALSLEPDEIDALMALWEKDRSVAHA